MKRHALFCVVGLLILMPRANAQKPFTLEQVMSAPFPSNLTAAKNANRIAWVLDQEGRRNIWVAEGPAFLFWIKKAGAISGLPKGRHSRRGSLQNTARMTARSSWTYVFPRTPTRL